MSQEVRQEHGMRRLYATALELGPLLLFFLANSRWGIFVGHWAPTLFGLGNALRTYEK